MATNIRQLKFGISSVRGVVGEALTPELAVNLSCALGAWADGGKVIVARDTRRSSQMLYNAVTCGLISSGCEVIDIGITTTPLASWTVREQNAAAGVCITGSHNDGRWNALKFLDADGALMNSAKSEELLDIYHAAAFLNTRWNGLKPVSTCEGVPDGYIDNLLSLVDAEAISKRKFRVAVDFCNGAAIEPFKKLFEKIHATLLPLNDQPTGEFAHMPTPTPVNMRQLAALMPHLNADLGAVVNIDGDRCAFLTESGKALSEEYTLPMAVKGLITRRPGGVVTNLSSSSMIDAVVQESGGRVIRTSVGEASVVNAAVTRGMRLAGEGSGTIAAPPEVNSFDAILALLSVLEQLAVGNISMSQLAGSLPVSHMCKGQVEMPPTSSYQLLDLLRKYYEDEQPSMEDGIRVAWPDKWLHIRASNTEPLLRMICEADTLEKAQQLYSETMSLVNRFAASGGVRHA